MRSSPSGDQYVRRTPDTTEIAPDEETQAANKAAVSRRRAPLRTARFQNGRCATSRRGGVNLASVLNYHLGSKAALLSRSSVGARASSTGEGARSAECCTRPTTARAEAAGEDILRSVSRPPMRWADPRQRPRHQVIVSSGAIGGHRGDARRPCRTDVSTGAFAEA